MFVIDEYTQEQMKALRDEAIALRDRLITLEITAAGEEDIELRDRVQAIGWKASARWQRRAKKAAFPTAWEYGLEGDSALIFSRLVRGLAIDVMGDVPFTIMPLTGLNLRWYKIIPQDATKKPQAVRMLEWWEVASWAQSLTLQSTKEAQQ